MATIQASSLVEQYLLTIQQSAANGQVLDLACGSGRNGVYLVNQGQDVVFADRQQSRLDEISNLFPSNDAAKYWCVDFEAPECDPLAGRSFSSILVFRYLHRPLMSAIKRAVQPGGLIVYETFTVDQPRFGRPSNPNFLLQPGELKNTFHDWELLHSFEGVSESSGQQQAIAQIVARKPS